MRPAVAILVAVIVAALSTACSSGGAATGRLVEHASATGVALGTTDPAPGTTVPATRAKRSAQPETVGTRSTFCAAARRIGLTGLSAANGTSGADSAAMLRAVDRLAVLAPTEIRRDFLRFDRFEHAILDARNGRTSEMKKLDSPELLHAMQHVGSYLANSCGISQ